MTERLHDPSPSPDELAALREGLSRPLPELAPKYLYDDRGSALFERITELPEYYPTRTELAILERDAEAIMADANAKRLVELGSGAGRKIRLLLEQWKGRDGGACTMLDVNQRFLDESVRALAVDFSGCAFDGVLGDFTQDLARVAHGGARLTVFFAGTIGNLFPHERARFFGHFAERMAPEDSLLVGADLVKDPSRIEAAYNDAQGVTAEFNKNALRVVNDRYGADFDVDAFDHVAFFDRELQRIEMRLRARRPVRATVRAIDLDVALPAGGEIRTEISCKFTRESFTRAVEREGLSVRAWRTDPDELFALAHVWRAR
jgi:L-histidine N-alpha-methyltransferase